MPTKCDDETVRETVEDQDDGFIDHKETGVTDGARPTDHHFELTSKPLEINLYEDQVEENEYDEQIEENEYDNEDG